MLGLRLDADDAALGHSAEEALVERRDEEWNEAATLALLQAWGKRYIEHGRGSLSRNDWAQITEYVVRMAKSLKTETQCRNRIDALKKKFKREKHKQAANGEAASNWMFYKHLENILNPSPPIQHVKYAPCPMTNTMHLAPSEALCLPCAVDAGERVRMEPASWRTENNEPGAAVPLNMASVDDDHIDSSEVSNSSSSMSDNELDECQTSKKQKRDDEASFDSLADAIKRLGEIYERMESAKQQQLLDLERARMEFTRNLELQKMQLLMQTQVELAKMKHGTTDMDTSVNDLSG